MMIFATKIFAVTPDFNNTNFRTREVQKRIYPKKKGDCKIWGLCLLCVHITNQKPTNEKFTGSSLYV